MLFRIFIINFNDKLGVLVHLLVGLSNDERLFSLASQNEELNSLSLRSLSLTVVGNHLRALGQLVLRPEDVLGLLWIVQVVQIQPNDVLVVIGSLVGLFSLFVVSFLLLRVGKNISQFPSTSVNILTTTVAECTQAGLKQAAY